MPAFFQPPRMFLLISLIFFFNFLPAQENRPNIIYIMADDMGYADLSCYGRKDYQTPHLDKLAMQGVKLMNAYAAAPVCTPTRTSFMTGRYPARTPVGLYEPLTNSRSDSLIGLSRDYPSIATLMHRAGYATYLVGKWHLGFLPQYSPMENGFDYFFGFHAGAIDYISHSHDLYENDKPVNVDGYLTDIWAQKTVEIIRQSHQKPFFIALMFNAPHWPWQAPGDKPFADTSGDASSWSKGGSPSIYAAMVKSLDDAVGTIVQTLDEQGLSKNTVVIFTSDNGGERYSDNGIYSGNKMQLLEGGIREPAIVWWPEKIAEHSTSNQAVITMDWTATILSLAGGKADPKFPLDGMNVMPILMQQKKEISRTFYWRLARRAHQKAIVSGYWKYLQDEKGEYLFNLAVDPSEKNDLHQQQPALFQKLKQQYANWEATVLKPGPDLAAKQ